MRLKLSLVVAVVCMLAVLGGTAFAEKPLTPETLKGAQVVDDAWVKANIGKVKIFDVRLKAEYIEGHLPGAVSVQYKEKSEKAVEFDSSADSFDLSQFPSDKNAAILVYCNGPRCWKSYKASVQLIRAGYTNIHWYRNGGFPGWQSMGYPVEVQ